MRIRLQELRGLLKHIYETQVIESAMDDEEFDNDNDVEVPEDDFIDDFETSVADSELDSSPQDDSDVEERGADIHGFWYRSPGRPMGTEGDPYRPLDAAEFIGQKRKEVSDDSDVEEV